MSVGLANRSVGGFDGSGPAEFWEGAEAQMAARDLTYGLSDGGMRYLLGEGQDSTFGKEVGRQRLEGLSQLGMVGVRGEQVLPPMPKSTLLQLGRTGIVRRDSN